ncbi:(d)CMP kinase [Cephaloticoccus primus]|uniref:(d)CMP kinase n=1 Tax=Cephaloticoccus primus TaxID=1548207 RepID=UPI0008398AD7|nr:(d)CMP kinase [Cephaloticoccus primus]
MPPSPHSPQTATAAAAASAAAAERDAPIIVAIDGGAASGKSSTARSLAARFGLLHVDTGSFYRHLTAELLARGAAADEQPALDAVLRTLRFSTRVAGYSAQMLIEGRAAGDEIRGATVNARVSHYAAVPAVRRALLAYQRAQAQVAHEHGFRGVVMEGRDIGSVIFPEAEFRFFLHADASARAARRAAEGREDSIAERDRLDTSRKEAPLVCPAGAIDIDTTQLSLAEVIERIAAIIARKRPELEATTTQPDRATHAPRGDTSAT